VTCYKCKDVYINLPIYVVTYFYICRKSHTPLYVYRLLLSTTLKFCTLNLWTIVPLLNGRVWLEAISCLPYTKTSVRYATSVTVIALKHCKGCSLHTMFRTFFSDTVSPPEWRDWYPGKFSSSLTSLKISYRNDSWFRQSFLLYLHLSTP